MVLQVIISAVIGYSLLIVSYNKSAWWPESWPDTYRYLVLLLIFSVIGFIGSETQLLANHLLFNHPDYAPFQAGGIYLFNAILASILGFMTLKWTAIKTAPSPDPAQAETLSRPEEATLTKIPLKKGDATLLKPLAEVIYFEAYDNYSFLHDADGQRSLCNYSLAHLEGRLNGRFLRVHRKYLINTERVASIAPHLKGRFVITFTDVEKSSLISSAGFSDEVKALLKI